MTMSSALAAPFVCFFFVLCVVLDWADMNSEDEVRANSNEASPPIVSLCAACVKRATVHVTVETVEFRGVSESGIASSALPAARTKNKGLRAWRRPSELRAPLKRPQTELLLFLGGLLCLFLRCHLCASSV